MSPHPAAFAAAEGSLAPPPQTMFVPSLSTLVSCPASFITTPWKPSSETSRFEPDPTTPTGRPSDSAQASSSTTSASDSGRAKKSAGPPALTVVSRESG